MNPYRIQEHWTNCWQVAGHHSCAVEQLVIKAKQLKAAEAEVKICRQAYSDLLVDTTNEVYGKLKAAEAEVERLRALLNQKP